MSISTLRHAQPTTEIWKKMHLMGSEISATQIVNGDAGRRTKSRVPWALLTQPSRGKMRTITLNLIISIWYWLDFVLSGQLHIRWHMDLRLEIHTDAQYFCGYVFFINRWPHFHCKFSTLQSIRFKKTTISEISHLFRKGCRTSLYWFDNHRLFHCLT